VRVVPRGRAAYDPVIRFRDPWAVQTPVVFASEAERLRLERLRLEAARLAEQERLARMTEEERRAYLAAAEARRRAEADAVTRTTTEMELERARREAADARAAAEAAERRAREAEDRMYRALLDLDRLIANVTAIRETERGLTIMLGEGLFDVGQHTLSPRARDEVQRIAAVLLQFPQHPVSVEGHTDSTGSLALNQHLSEQRAHAVRAGLVAEGVDPNRVGVVGHGPLLPIADNATGAGRAQNRRVEIVLLGAQRPAAQVIR
jgi:outer membrane protein OmpA-like peptidoglycan-associated protein